MATAFFRTIILYLLLIVGLRLTGKRQIGELEPIELVLTMLLSDLASVPMQDFDSPLINGVVPILTLLALTTLLSYISFRSGRFRSLICGEPAIVVRCGRLQQRAMRHNRMTVDELMEELRDLIEAGAPGMPIGMTAALEAAATYAGLTTADVADADVDPELDETPAHYEVELEVPGHGELEYRVDAYTGQVLSGPANVKLSAPVNQSGDIGMEAAKSAALKHAGLSSATFTKAERDYDDGRWEYELEFHTDTAAYEVTLDAISGSVLDYEKENLRSSSTSDIGAQAAKSAALRHAGLSEGQVQELLVEWDNEHGRAVYEVEFKSGGMEYEYVIDAATGSVLEHQAEQDD